MTEKSTPIETLARARQLTEAIAGCLPETVDASSLTLKSTLPFKALSLRETLLHRVSALASPAVALFEQRADVAAVILTRSVIETVAIVFALHRQLTAFLETKDVEALDEFLMNSLFASRWEDATHQARSILTFVDHVEKKVTGFRPTYDSLCEYAHPNWSGVFGAFGTPDHKKRILALGPSERSTVFACGVHALTGTLLTMQHFHNEMVPLLHRLNEHFELASPDVA